MSDQPKGAAWDTAFPEQPCANRRPHVTHTVYAGGYKTCPGVDFR